METRESKQRPSKYAVGIEYDGRRYCGWQRQPHSPSVQEHLEAGLSQIANESVRTVAAGRTDTAVHASMQVVDFVSGAQRTPYQWQRGYQCELACLN